MDGVQNVRPLPRTLLKSVRKTRGRRLPEVLFIVVVPARHPNLVRDEALRTVQSWSRRPMASMEALVLVTKRYSRVQVRMQPPHSLQHIAECDELRLE